MATALVLLGFMIVAIGTSLVFERRTFCRYLCPVGGFIGLYSQVAPLELRVKDAAVCASHTEKTCYTGSDDGYGCPWLIFPGGLTNNTACGLCTECLKTCTRDNIAIFVRQPGADLLKTTGHKLDEAYKGLIMLACAFIYSTVLIGPWGVLKETARAVGTPRLVRLRRHLPGAEPGNPARPVLAGRPRWTNDQPTCEDHDAQAIR